MRTLKRLIIEYEDGSTKAIPFSQLEGSVWRELSQMGVCPPSPESAKPSKNYLLLRWKNGWQEVVAIDQNAVELLRYYVLERVEEEGRIALELEADYPLLFTVKRLPKELDSLAIIGRMAAKVYDLEPKQKKEEGDKIEHVEYDRAEHHFQPEPEKTGEGRVQEMARLLEEEITKKGLSPKKLLNLEHGQREAEYKALGKAMGIRAMEKQEDVYGFLQLMIGKLAASEK